jgi:hypothetical protein
MKKIRGKKGNWDRKGGKWGERKGKERGVKERGVKERGKREGKGLANVFDIMENNTLYYIHFGLPLYIANKF